MSPSRWTVLVLVLVALAVSVAYGLRGGSGARTTAASLRPLQERAALDPCPAGLGDGFPKVTLPCLGGGRDVPLRAAAPGRPTVVNVYGSWCGPCQREMPVLRAFYERVRGRVALVGVDTDEQYPRLGLQFAIAMRQHWPALYDDSRVVGAHFSPGVPITVFVSPAGEVVHVAHEGGYHRLADLEHDVRAYLGVAV